MTVQGRQGTPCTPRSSGHGTAPLPVLTPRRHRSFFRPAHITGRPHGGDPCPFRFASCLDAMIAPMKYRASLPPTRYDVPTVIFHWGCAAIIVLQFATANSWGLFHNPLHHQLVVAHLTAGMVLSVLFPARLLWRLGWGRHIRAADRWLDAVLARGVEYSLYALVMLEIVLGYMWRWGNGQAMSFLSLQFMPPFGRFSASAISLLHGLHQWNGWLIIVLATGHGLAACFHYFILRDDVFQRMLVTGNASDEYGK